MLHADLIAAQLSIKNLRLWDPNGDNLVNIESAKVSLPMPWQQNRNLHIIIDEGHVQIQRFEEGTFNLESLIPKPKDEKPSDVLWSVSAKKVHLSFRDRYTKIEQYIDSEWDLVEVKGIGATANIFAVGEVYGIGSINLELDNNADGIEYLELKTINSDVERVRRYLLSLPELEDANWLTEWTATKTNYNGTVWLSRQADEWTFSGRGTVNAEGLEFANQRLNTAIFSGYFTNNSARGDFSLTKGSIRAEATGELWFGEEIALQLTGELTGVDSKSFTRMTGWDLPSDLSFSGANFKGGISYFNKPIVYGRLSADHLVWSDWRASDIQAKIISNGDSLRLTNVIGKALGANVRADLFLSLLDDQSIRGRFSAGQLQVNELQRLEQFIPEGTVNIQGILAGTLKNIQASMYATVDGKYQVTLGDESQKENFKAQAALELKGERLLLNALEASSKSGSLRSTGEYNFADGQMQFRIAGDGVRLSVTPGGMFDGIIFADARLTGTVEVPILNGQFEAYNVKYEEYDLPYVAGTTIITQQDIQISSLKIQHGVSQLSGDLKIGLAENQALEGRGNLANIDLSHWTQDRVLGLAQGDWHLSGTREYPQVVANISTGLVVADQIQANSIELISEWNKNQITLQKLVANINEGNLTAAGVIPFVGEGEIRAELNNVSASIFTPYLQGNAEIDGNLNGQAIVKFNKGALVTANAKVSIESLGIDQRPIGNGFVDVDFFDNQLLAQASVGNIQSNFILDSLKYDFNDRLLSMNLSVLGMPIHQIRSFIYEKLQQQLSTDALIEVASFDGILSSNSSLSLRLKDFTSPDTGESLTRWKTEHIDLNAQLSQLKYQGKPIGDISADITGTDESWLIAKAEWLNGPAQLRLSTLQPQVINLNSEISLDGELMIRDIPWFTRFLPQIEDLNGTIEVPFTVSGKTKTPTITFTMSGRNVAYQDWGVDALELGPFTWNAKMLNASQGTLQVRGAEAKLTQFELLMQNYRPTLDSPFNLKVVVPERDLDALHSFFGGLDVDKTEGKLYGGQVELSGTLNNINSKGSIQLYAESLKFEGVDSSINAVDAQLDFTGALATLTVQGTGSNGGRFEANVGVDFIERSLLSGSKFLAHNLAVGEIIGENNRLSGEISADVSFSGDMIQPLISGWVSGSKGLLDIRGEFMTGEEVGKLAVNPVFDLVLRLEDAVVKNALLTASTEGTGQLRGTIEKPDVQFIFTVDGGSINLPSGRVRLSEGGEAKLRYGIDWQGVTETHLDINLQAITFITANAGLGIQRYRINLNISGDLFADEDLKFEAESDPPDLTQSQILALLGQQQLFEEVAGVATGNFQSQVQNILKSLATPILLNPLTSAIEKTFGLDYVSFDIARSGIGSVAIAKALGSGFILEYRKTLDQYQDIGSKLDQLTLYYRPTRRNALWGGLNFAISLDQKGYFRATIGYSKRF